MKSYIRILSAVFVLVFAFCAVGMCSVSAEGEYTQPEKFIYGDVNQDLEVNVKDVTYIQKGLANLTYVTAVQRFLADPDSTGYSIKNATAIQKYLAKYEVSDLLGTELIMASQDEFSKDLPSNPESYEKNCIIVTPIYSVKTEYSLADFPEYEFTAIEKIGGIYDESMPTVYALYFEPSGDKSVLGALKSLNYRANLDLKYVYVSSISYSD